MFLFTVKGMRVGVGYIALKFSKDLLTKINIVTKPLT